MITRALVPIAWTIWAVLVAGTLFTLLGVLAERNPPSVGGRPLGVMVTVPVLGLLAAAGYGLHVAAQRQSTLGIVVMFVLIAYPGGMLVAIPAVKAFKEWRWAREDARVGDFRDPAAAEIARAIDSGDAAALANRLGGAPPPVALDRAGNDLLGYALTRVRDGKADASIVRTLLEVGADPRTVRLASGQHVLDFASLGRSPDRLEVLRLLLEHGADPNEARPSDGSTPLGRAYHEAEVVRLFLDHGGDPERATSNGVPLLVNLIGAQQWENALYLIERGANLDVEGGGLSIDYYLKSWQGGVYGAYSEGWNRVRDAIAARRAAPESTAAPDR